MIFLSSNDGHEIEAVGGLLVYILKNKTKKEKNEAEELS